MRKSKSRQDGQEQDTSAKGDFYTAKEAMKRLGLSSATFHRKAAKEEIPSVKLPGREFVLYPKRDIDALALAVELALAKEEMDFSRSAPGDQIEEWEIGVLCFGSTYITPIPQRVDFQKKSENTFWSLKVNGHVAVYGSMFYFPEEFLDDILTGKQVESAITLKQVLKFPKDRPFDLYIDVLASDPRIVDQAPNPKVGRHRRSFYSGQFVGHFANKLLDLIANGYQIRTLYTVTASKEGDKIVNEAGFKLMKGKSEKAGRLAYRFDLDEAGLVKLKEVARLVRRDL